MDLAIIRAKVLQNENCPSPPHSFLTTQLLLTQTRQLLVTPSEIQLGWEGKIRIVPQLVEAKTFNKLN